MVNVRKAVKQDKENILLLVRDFATSFKTNAGDFYKSFDSLLANESSAVFVAEDNNEIMGYCLGFVHDTFYANGKVGWLEEIMVKETQRKNGIGRMLIEAMESFAKENKCKLLALATRRASDFYLAIGYEESAIYFRKELSRE